MEIEIKHKETEQGGSFFIESEEGKQVGEIVYNLRKDTRLVILHTEVGEELKGTGAATKLVHKVADYAREKGYKIVPLCPFAKKYMNLKLDQFSDVLA